MQVTNELMLAGYAVNSSFLNHCIVAFLKRLSRPDSLNLEPMLYQVGTASAASTRPPRQHCSTCSAAQTIECL